MGTSLLTNQSAMTALQSLKTIGNNMDTTQNRISTGLRVSSAADNTAYWSISSMMRSDASSLGAVSDAMNLGYQQIDTAYQAVEQSKDRLNDMSQTLITAQNKEGRDVQKLQADLRKSMDGMENAIKSTTMAEKNFLTDGGSSVRVTGGYRREDNAVYVDMIDVGGKTLNFGKTDATTGKVDLSSGVVSTVFGSGTVKLSAASFKTQVSAVAKAQADLDAWVQGTTTSRQSLVDAVTKARSDLVKEILKSNVSVKDFAEAKLDGMSGALVEGLITAMGKQIETANQNVLDAGADLGASMKQIKNQQKFVGLLTDSLDKGIGSLVDADMNKESARLASLQVQQQLGVQALSIANQNSQNILALFRG